MGIPHSPAIRRCCPPWGSAWPALVMSSPVFVWPRVLTDRSISAERAGRSLPSAATEHTWTEPTPQGARLVACGLGTCAATTSGAYSSCGRRLGKIAGAVADHHLICTGVWAVDMCAVTWCRRQSRHPVDLPSLGGVRISLAAFVACSYRTGLWHEKTRREATAGSTAGAPVRLRRTMKF